MHPTLKSLLEALGLNEDTPPNAQTWKQLLEMMSVVYEERDSALTQFSALFEQNNDAVFLLDLQGKHQFVNQQASQMLGYSVEELVDLTFYDTIVQDQQHLSLKVRDALFAGEKPGVYERTFRHKSGYHIPTEVNVSLVHNADGSPLYIQSVVRDITRRKNNAEQLRQSEERFRNLVKYLPIGVLLQGAASEIILSNPMALELLGLTEDQLLGRSSFDPDWNVIHEDGSPFPGDTHPVPQAIATRRPVRDVVMGVYRPIHKDRVWLLVNAEPLLSENGNIREVICTFNDISTRKQIELALQSSEQQLRLITNGISDMVMYFQASVVKYANPAIELLLGYKPEDWVGKTSADWLAVVHPEDREEVIDNQRKAVLTGAETHFQCRLRLANGTYRWFETFGGPVDIQSTIHRVTVTRDVHDTKLAQQTLRESESRYRELWAESERQRKELELLSEVRTIIGREMDIDALIRTIVETTAEKLGYTHTSLYMLHGETLVLQHYVGYDQVIHEIPISTAVSGRVVRNRKPELVVSAQADTDFVEVIGGTKSMICVPLFKGGDVAGVYMIESPDKVLTEYDLRLLTALGEHISIALERAGLYTDLHESKTRYELVVDNIRDVIFQIDTEGRWTFLNSAWAQVTGFPVETSLNQPFVQFIHPEDAVESARRFQRLVDGAFAYSQRRLRYLHKNGDFIWVESRVWPMFSMDGTPLGVSGTLIDITEQLESEETTLRMVSQARMVEALKYFLTAVSHDLRTPLSVLNTSAYLIRRRLDQPDKLVHHLDVVEKEIAHLSTMVEDMVEMSKVDEEMIEFQFSPLNLNDLVQSACNSLEDSAHHKDHQLSFTPDKQIPVFKADADMLHRAIKKLIHNAVQYTVEGGAIQVRTRWDSGCAFVEVADNGMGIAADHIPHIFDRFYKVDEARTAHRGGIGLGLTYVKKIVEAHGGNVHVESAIGKGSTFIIKIPLDQL